MSGTVFFQKDRGNGCNFLWIWPKSYKTRFFCYSTKYPRRLEAVLLSHTNYYIYSYEQDNLFFPKISCAMLCCYNDNRTGSIM